MRRWIALVALLGVSSVFAQNPDLKGFATRKLQSNSDWSDTARTARLCESADRKQLSPQVMTQCANGFEAEAKKNLSSDPGKARNALNFAIAFGLPQDRSATIDAPLKKAEAIADAKFQKERAKRQKEQAKRDAQRKQEDAKAAAAVRLSYGKRLREKFLDDGLDIKVNVSGAANKTITLKFALFNDVWTHKMQKGDLLTEMQSLGFTRVNVTDGYDYSVYWTFK